jgi:RNA polymerase sigma-70 factor (ECF subfamily)
LTGAGQNFTLKRESRVHSGVFSGLERWAVTEPTHDEAARWLAAARAGSGEALGQALEAYRGYLLLIAGRELDPELRTKGGASDLVQETFLEAQRDFAAFRGDNADELRAWLRRLLLNNLATFARRYRDTAKRQLGRELPLQAGDTPSPSGLAMAREEAEALEKALAQLSEEHRQVILLRHQGQLSFEEIGARLGRSANAARMLWTRAVDRLQQLLDVPP